ncbi:unnamed protein product [Echinostoma caproni]|uniref:Fatty-acid amide hydrolase 1 n=1 Tax=Echinostoma caproni TaxID=27848 RepID=A0A183A9X2_9TREM|nr:unnamed protein product [Echinostoma caproni]
MDIVGAHWAMLVGFLGRYTNKKIIVTCGLSALLIRILHQYYRKYQLNKRLKRKKLYLEKSFSSLRSALETLPDSREELLALTELDLCDLRKKIADGTLTPARLLHAYQLKALSLFDKGNSGICEFVREAENRAQNLHPVGDASKRSPLYGIPISVKETLLLTGYDSTAGLIKRCNMPARNMVNPYNPERITGGSTCGEAVLLTQRGSPVGIGTDIGGSIRIPAAFCGLASLKPTYRRLSSVGLHILLPSSSIVLHPCFYDTFTDPHLMHTVPVIRESINQAAAALAKAGHHIVRFEPPNILKAYRLFLRALFADGGSELRSILAHEPLCKQLKMLRAALLLPHWMKTTADFVLSIIGCRPMALTCSLSGLYGAKDFSDLQTAIQSYRQEFASSISCMSAVICPVSAYPAPPCSAPPALVTFSLFYAALYNLLDYPAGTVLTGFVDRVDVMEATKATINQRLDGELFQSRVSVMQKNSEGLPVAVQVVGKPFREETVLRVMRTLESSLAQPAPAST